MIRGWRLSDGAERHQARMAALELAGELGEPSDQAELRRRIWPVPCPVCQARPGEPCGGPGGTLVPGWHTRRWDAVFSAGLAVVSQESESVWRELTEAR